jgi:RNA polymerase sigma-70 factor, ECF subfamily
MDRPSGVADPSLLARFVAGDERAFAALFDDWSAPVYRLALRIVQDGSAAEEVVEETFWQAWTTRASFDAGRAGIAAWLLMIARSRALDRRRAAGRRREAGSEPLERMASRPVRDTAEVEETTRLVRSALRELPAEQREVIELAYFEGLSQTEIALRTAQPLGTVKSRSRMAMDKLRDRLGMLRGDR